MTSGERERFQKRSLQSLRAGGCHSERRLARPLGVEENIGLSVAHFLHAAHLHLRVVAVDPESWKKRQATRRLIMRRNDGRSAADPKSLFLTSFRVVAVCGVVPWAEAFTVMHNDSRQIVGVASSVDRVTRVCAAVRLDVQNLVEGHVDADFLPMVPPWPSAAQQELVSARQTHKRGDKHSISSSD